MTIWLKQSTACTIMFGPFVDKTDGVTLKTDATTITDIDHATTGIFLSKNGAAAAIRHQAVTASVADAYGMMKVTLDTTDTGTLGSLDVLFAKAATYLPVHKSFEVVAANVYNSLIGGGDVLDVSAIQFAGQTITAAAGVTLPSSVASPTNITAGTITTVTNVTNAVLVSSGSGAGQLDITSGVVKANMTQIDGQATNGNNATLNLKKLDIQNNAGDALICKSTGSNGRGIVSAGNGTGDGISISGGSGGGYAINAYAANQSAVIFFSDGGDGFDLQGTASGLMTFPGGGYAGIDADIDGNLWGSVGAIPKVTIKKNTALSNFAFVMTDTDGVPLTGLSPAAARRIDSGSFAACANTPATELANGWYTIDLADSDLNGTVIALRFSDTGASDTNFTIVTQD